jgi:hypothetical protein
MKKILPLTIVIILISVGFGIPKKTVQEENILKKVANAHGYQNWKKIKEINFTFNVDRDTSHFERRWGWKTESNDINAISAKDTLRYNWSNMDSTALKTNAGFINDKFWLLAPYQLVWDADNIEHKIGKEAAPISKKPMHKLTVVYGNEGGYTPGDAYDFYFEDDYIIREWIFRKSNQKEPSMITTFEDYVEINGLKLAKMHKMAEGSFKLYFTDVSVR